MWRHDSGDHLQRTCDAEEQRCIDLYRASRPYRRFLLEAAEDGWRRADAVIRLEEALRGLR